MSSAICQNFVQNAWKKELCSNCFKSKDEHAEPPKPKPVNLISNDKIEGIIRNSDKNKPKRSVSFPQELTEFIGYGGEDWQSDDEDLRDDDDSSSDDDFVAESEGEEELKRITKENTDFNTTNLKAEVSVKKTTQLLLGKPIMDSNGRKQTLMVSVTPFGEDTPPSPKRFIKTLSHIPISKTKDKESKQTVVLTSYTKNEEVEEKSLLDEITETLENKIQIISKKKIDDENKENKPKLSRTPALKKDDKPIIYQTSTAKIELMNNKNSVISREQAGEPDGRADPPETEPPALPLTPPPILEPQYDKPKIPAKPIIRKPSEEEKRPLVKQDSDSKNKRRAPKPPEEIYTRNLTFKNDPPVLRELDKRKSDLPEIAPRKSLSTDSLISEEKRKKGRFSLKKFLRMGGKDSRFEAKYEEIEIPVPKPRLVIVHPTDLNGSNVEFMNNYYEKPPPPPRNYDDKPNLPPPKSCEILKKQQQYSSVSHLKKTETVYANIGEVRSAIVPNKPQRTASMRENDKKMGGSTYETIGENIYDYVNGGSSPDSSGSSSPKKNSRLNKRSESSIDVSGEYCRFGGQIPRSISLTYCGSETESEIYSPYSFYGSESEVTEDDHDWVQNGRTHKLRSRKGRSIVHKNLEDNYGAVIVANHEALAQVLENIQQTTYIQPALRGLKTSPNLRWSDFSIKSTTPPLIVGGRIFQEAIWNTHHVTLLINMGAVPSSTLNLGTHSLQPITEFSDLIPEDVIGGNDEKLVQSTVTILPWLQVSTIPDYSIKNEKESSFIMLQLVNALKILQAQGIEELSLNLNSFILCKEMNQESHLRLCILQGLTETEQLASLCMCASKALSFLLPNSPHTHLLQSLLNNERAVTLTQVKSILEFSLWGPSDVALGSTIKERELALQRWLDLQRATVLHGLVCTRVQLTVYEECHLYFLVRSTARMMSDASLLLESSKIGQK